MKKDKEPEHEGGRRPGRNTQTRWMLWLEEGNTLRLLSGIPRAWLNDGQTIASFKGKADLVIHF